MSQTFYVSDSFTLSFQDFKTTGAWHYPGPFNQDTAWGPNQKVDVEVLGMECAHIVYANASSPEGTAMDVYMGLYDITTPGVATPVDNYRLKFLAANGSEMAEAVLMNSISRIGLGLLSPVSRRQLAAPLRIGGMTPNVAGRSYQLGAVMRFFGNGPVLNSVPTEYEYFIQGRVTVAPPAPPVGSELRIVTPGGTWKWTGVMVP